jgi:phosphotriesterase-related protein
MGTGFYLETSMPPEVSGMSKMDIADRIVGEALEGVDGTGSKVGIIGEIGVSADFTDNERKSLRGAAMAQKRTGLPLMVHLPGWFRRAGEVLDMVEEEGADLRHTVLCHMNPSWYDTDYQLALAARGAFLEYDMVGMDFWYADQGVQCPSDDENARGIKALIDAGFGDRVLVSQDVFLKIMLTSYGGFGYAYIQKHFLPRLKRHGVTDPQIQALMVDNPRSVFSTT